MKTLLIEALAIVAVAGVVGTAFHEMRGDAEKKIPLVPRHPALTYPQPFKPARPSVDQPEPGPANPTTPSPPTSPVGPTDEGGVKPAPGAPPAPGPDSVEVASPPAASGEVAAADGVPEISVEVAFAEYEAGGALFIDARHAKLYREGHVAGARSLSPYAGNFEPKLEEILNERDPAAPVLIYCTGGDCKDSHNVAQRFKLAGFLDIRVMKAGFDGWKNAGHPVETGEEGTE